MFKINKIIYLIIFLITNLLIFSQNNSDLTNDKSSNIKTDNTSDLNKVKTDDNQLNKKPRLIDENYVPPKEDLKKFPVVFDMGGSVSLNSRILFKYFQVRPVEGGIEPVPDDLWIGDLTGKIWARMSFDDERYLHLGVRTLFKFQRYDYGYRQNNLNLLFNIDEAYLNWKYIIGKIVIGRTTYNLKSGLVFNGPLDGMEVDINIPYLNFKAILGYTGLLGIFNPYFNPYYVTSYDNLYREDSNLLMSNMIIKFNAEQARRIFFGTDFDINFFGQHINPYFLMQYDINPVFYNLKTDIAVNTYHIGLNIEGRIATNFYYKTHLSGMLGTHPTSTPGVIKSIVACAFESNLRYTIPSAGYSTFVAGYAFGTGNKEGIGEWSDFKTDSNKGFWSDKYDGKSNNKYYYYGRFDGGYVLNPVLSNIHSISFKYMVTPFNNGASQITLYLSFYQTLKLNQTGAISDDECNLPYSAVGSEVDTGLMANIGANFNIGYDFGMFIPEYAYRDRSLRFRMGITMAVVF